MKVINEYENSHHYIEHWFRTVNYHCPNCGDKNNLFVNDTGDYYIGSEYICTSCGKSSYLDQCGSAAKESIVEQLKSGVVAIPTTKQGR